MCTLTQWRGKSNSNSWVLSSVYMVLECKKKSVLICPTLCWWEFGSFSARTTIWDKILLNKNVLTQILILLLLILHFLLSFPIFMLFLISILPFFLLLSSFYQLFLCNCFSPVSVHHSLFMSPFCMLSCLRLGQLIMLQSMSSSNQQQWLLRSVFQKQKRC